MKQPTRTISIIISVAVGLFAACHARPSWAHPTPTAQAAIQLADGGHYSIAVRCDVAAYLLQATPGHLGNELAEELRTMSPAELDSRLADAKRSFQDRLDIQFDGQPHAPATIEFPTAEALREAAQAHDSADSVPQVIRIEGTVPKEARAMTVRFPVDIGLVGLNLSRGQSEPIHYALGAGDRSPELPLREQAFEAAAQRPTIEVARDYLVLGFEHILPKGLDHILFVLALYLLSPQLTALIWQVTLFTIAHSITLTLSSLGIVSLSPAIVEPLIALSIALIALENLFTSELKPWRGVIVFAMGLIHGLGFAGVLSELGLPRESFATAQVSFNLGVEFGQFAVILLAFATVGWFRNRAWYRARIVIPASCILAAIGIYWTIERALG